MAAMMDLEYQAAPVGVSDAFRVKRRITFTPGGEPSSKAGRSAPGGEDRPSVRRRLVLEESKDVAPAPIVNPIVFNPDAAKVKLLKMQLEAAMDGCTPSLSAGTGIPKDGTVIRVRKPAGEANVELLQYLMQQVSTKPQLSAWQQLVATTQKGLPDETYDQCRRKAISAWRHRATHDASDDFGGVSKRLTNAKLVKIFGQGCLTAHNQKIVGRYLSASGPRVVHAVLTAVTIRTTSGADAHWKVPVSVFCSFRIVHREQ